MSIESIETCECGKSKHELWDGNVTKVVRFFWKCDGPLKPVLGSAADYDVLPPLADFKTDDGEDGVEWDVMDTFSVDSC